MAGHAFQGLVLLHVVVSDRAERNHMHAVLESLRVRIRKAGEAAHLHPHGEISPLCTRRGDVLRIGAAVTPYCDRRAR